MRYLVGFSLAMALMAAPLKASAQPAEGHAEPQSSQAQASAQPAVQLKLDSSGVGVAPSSARSEYVRSQLRPPRAGLGVSTVLVVGGIVMMGAAFANVEPVFCFSLGDPCAQTPGWVAPVAVVGTLSAVGGLTGMIISAKRLAGAKKAVRWYAGESAPQHRSARRVQWDLARSRLVF